MELRHLRSFLALADELHFGRAAEKLGIAQPPLSRHIQQLEAEIGTALFERTPRRVSLTRAGERLRERVRPHVDGLVDALAEARRIGAGRAGRLRVGYGTTLSYVFLPRLLERLREEAPGASFDLREMNTPVQTDSLRDQVIDVGLAVLPVDDAGGLMRRVLFDERLMVVLKDDHALAAEPLVWLNQLVDEPFVMCPRYQRSSFKHVILDRCMAVGFNPRIVQEVEGKALLTELVASGLGISIVPESASWAGRSGVVYRPLGDDLAPVQFCAIWRAENHEPLLRLFLDTAVAVARDCRRPEEPAAAGTS